MTDEEEVIFNAEQFKRFMDSDALLQLSFNHLSKNNPNANLKAVMEVVFNTFVLDDSAAIREYNKFKKEK